MLQNKNFVMQGGVRNYLGKTEEIKKAPKYWQSSPDSPKTELSYITDAEKELLLKANLHGSLINQQPNVGASGILSFDGWGDASDGFGSSSSNDSGGSSGDSGGYDTSYTYQPTTSQIDLSFSSTGSYDEPGALSQPSTITGPTDPGLAGEDAVTWTVDKNGNLTVESTPDSITNFGQNLKAEFKSNPLNYLSPTGTMAKVGLQTLAANYLLGNIRNPFATWNSPSQDYFNKINPPVYTGDSGGDSTTQQVSTPTQTISGVEMESPAQKFYNQQQQTGQLSFQSDYDAAKQKVNGLLGTPSALGLLAVNDSPFYDFLKSINLNRRII